MDENLEKQEFVAFHPMDNTATIELLTTDFFKFINHHKIPHQKLNLSQEVVKVEEKKKGEKKPDHQVNLLGVESKKNEKFSNWYQ